MKSLDMPLQLLRRELQSSLRNQSVLNALNSIITKSINHADGEERETLMAFQDEVTHALQQASGGISAAQGSTAEPRTTRSHHE